MTADHSSYERIARSRRGSADYHEGHDEARRAFLIGQAVRERRLALNLSQTQVASDAGMTQPALSRLEAGGSVPTIPVLDRIAVALGAELIVTLRTQPGRGQQTGTGPASRKRIGGSWRSSRVKNPATRAR